MNNSCINKFKNISVYIHIPFCVKKCNYCDFLSFPASKDIQDRYFNSLEKEIRCAGEWLKNSEERYLIRSIFFGGGTPSLADPKMIASLLDTLRESFCVDKEAEITIEMNPGTVTGDSLDIYKKAGINRISIGCQSLGDDELKELGRIHDSKTFYETFHAARKAGFDNINVDLMSALPGQTAESYGETLRKILELRPEHISAYSLIIEEGTPFYEKYKDVIDRDMYDIEDELVKEGVVDPQSDALAKEKRLNKDEISNIKPLPSEDEERKMYEDTIEILKNAGYHRYEVSNYARNDGDYECYHNKAYWKRADYLGFGIGAAGMVSDERFTNTDDINVYCKYWDGTIICDSNDKDTVKSGGRDICNASEASLKYSSRPMLEHDKLSTKACMEETMFLGLRMDEGVSIGDFNLRFGLSIKDVYGRIVDKQMRDDLIMIDNDHLKLTKKGLEVSNVVLSEYLLD